MSGKDKRSNKKRKDDYKEGGEETEKASKEEFKVAKWIRKNVQVKKTKFLNHNVEYFTSAKVLDALMSSKFAQDDNCLFPTRQAAVDYLDMMLTHKFFHRAKKVPVSEQELKGRTKEKSKDHEKETKTKETDAESSHAEGKQEKAEKAPEKKKRKIRLEMHPQQIFVEVDGHEPYVWIYDPIPMHYWVFGALVVIGAIVICLFPLWPPQLRTGVYYLSMTAAGFLVFLLALVVVRFILFCVIWIASGGKHHFWFLPNLTEDVGFIDSFKPLYKHDYLDGNDSEKNKKDKKKKKKKESDDEGDKGEKSTSGETTKKSAADDGSLRQRKGEVKAQNDTKTEKDEQEDTKNSESESSDSQRSSTGKDFEMLEAEEDEEDEP